MYQRKTSPIKEDEVQQSEAVDHRLSPEIFDQVIQINPIKPTDLKNLSNLICTKSTKTAMVQLNTDSNEEIKEVKQNKDIMRLSSPIEQSKKSARRPRTSYQSGKPGISGSRAVKRELQPMENIIYEVSPPSSPQPTDDGTHKEKSYSGLWRPRLKPKRISTKTQPLISRLDT